MVGLMPDMVARTAMEHAGVDRLAVFNAAMDTVRRAGTVSLSGVYGGTADPVNMLQAFDKGINIRMGQAHVKRWIDDLMPLVSDDSDPLGVEDPLTSFRSSMHHMATRSSRRRKTTRSRSC